MGFAVLMVMAFLVAASALGSFGVFALRESETLAVFHEDGTA
jgi:hypothetical protein